MFLTEFIFGFFIEAMLFNNLEKLIKDYLNEHEFKTSVLGVIGEIVLGALCFIHTAYPVTN
jgi:hypothetical protein